ncbi:Plasma-membrane choline transporter [Trypanosoma brucei equiperdum]|uniref:Choline transporter-like protein n=1 Tax=Trypanosoma brucei equiperdum TaxID=630700 RepID=A0A3L6KXF0_9TRYP|nr:Plasma-membrane choline transporter [Trypanosoma brucei equiperdum]
MTQKGYVGVPEEPYRSKFTPEVGPYYGFEGEGAHAVPLQGIPLYQGEGNNQEGLKRFVVQGYKDVWAAILYILCILATIGLGIYNICQQGLRSLISADVVNIFWACNDDSCIDSVCLFFLLAFAFSVIVCLSSLSLMKRFASGIIKGCNVILLIFYVVAFLFSVWAVNNAFAIPWFCMLVVHLLWFFFAGRRIPLAAELLKSSSTVVCNYKALCAVNAVLFGAHVFFSVMWASVMKPLYAQLAKMELNPSAGGARNEEDLTLNILFLSLLALLFVMFWATQVTTNLMHVTTAGLTATWYFAGKENMPKNPTLASFKRGTTTSFGSICFGSLLVAIIRLIRWLVSTAEDSEHEMLRCIFLCIIGCLERLMEYFNTYAFVHVAIYGCGYIEAAKMTWELCKRCSCAALFNDRLIDVTLFVASFIGSLLVGGVFGLLFRSWDVFLIGFVVCMLVHLFVFSSVTSAVTTLFVCYAEVPEGLEHSSPDLYAALQRTDQNGTSNGAAPPRV